MNEKLKDVQTKVLEFWNKYDKKRKVQLISVVVSIIIMLVILALVVSKTSYTALIECEDTVTAASITDILKTNSIDFKTENEGLTILVDENKLVDATYMIAQEGYAAKGYTMEDYVKDVGIGTPTSDRERLYQKYLEDKMVKTIESFDFVKKASVTFMMPSTNYSALQDQEETYVSVQLSLRKAIPDGAADSMAKYIATSVGNRTTSKVTIVDSQGKTLYANSDETDSVSMSSSQMENIRNLFDEQVITNVTKIFNATGYSSVNVAPALDLSFDKVDIVDTEYYNPENLKFSDYIYEQEGSSGASGIPGTDSNDDDTTYLIDTGEGTTTSVKVNKNEYALSSVITHTEGQRGKCDYDNSSVTIVLNRYQVYDEETADLGGDTWEEFKAKNSERVLLEIDEEDITAAISMATRIPVDKIHVTAYSIPAFNDYVSDTDFTRDILPIIIAVIILALLGFIVWRSLRPIKVTDIDTELSVEELLASTREKQLPVEEIDLDEKSEVRKAIEKFVDENPEAVALLMRNWLNDDWE